MRRLLACAALTVAAAACAARPPAARPPAPSTATEPSSPPRAPRIAIVDLARAMRVHPRWPEVTVLDRQIVDMDARIAAAAQAPLQPLRLDLPKIDLGPEVKATVERMRPEFQQQVEAAKAAGKAELDAYVAALNAEQQKKLDAKRAEVQAELAKSVTDKQQALNKDNQHFQQQTMAEYRLPLLNLKLKAEDVQQSSKAEQEQVSQQQQALLKERDEKIAAHEKANQQALQQFQQDQIASSNATLQAFQAQLSKESEQLVAERAAQLTEQVRAQLEAKRAEFNQRLRDQQQSLIAAARQTQSREIERAKAQIQERVQAETGKIRTLQDELRALERSRARLYGVIVADIRIESAALAQEKGWDMVLTQAISAPGTVDATDELIARLRR